MTITQDAPARTDFVALAESWRSGSAAGQRRHDAAGSFRTRERRRAGLPPALHRDDGAA